tara:strand:+ start:641 stop:2035 length:1395 start_codon:yes stop_codon:yes gene_type:complete
MAFTDRLHNRGSVSTGYDIDYSLLLEGSDSEKLSRTPSSDGNMQTWTVSCWVKRTELHSNQMIFSAADTYAYFTTGDVLQINLRSPSSGNRFLVTNRIFEDTAAWYHIVMRVDVGNSTAADKCRLYVNGVQETSLSNTGYTNTSGNTAWNDSSRSHVIGNYISGDYYKHGYIAEFHSIDGQSLGPDSFGETNTDGEWVPKEYTGTYGSQGFYLDFADASDLGDDESGNGNDFTESNIDSKNQSTDTPTNNFCTLNNNSRTNGNIRTIYGGSYISTDGGSGWCSMNATMGVSNGKWYWESKRIDTYVMLGIAGWNDPWVPHRSGGYYLGNVATSASIGWYFLNGNVYNGGSGWNGPSNGDTAMVALDMDNLRVYFGVNGTWQNSSNPAGNSNGQTLNFSGVSGGTEIILPSVSVYQGNEAEFNFGGYTKTTISSGQSDANGYGNFEYSPPSGFYALCSKNLAEFG